MICSVLSDQISTFTAITDNYRFRCQGKQQRNIVACYPDTITGKCNRYETIIY